MTDKRAGNKVCGKPVHKTDRQVDVAYKLGRAAGKVSLVIKGAVSHAGEEIDKAREAFKAGYGQGAVLSSRARRVRRIDRPEERGPASLSPILNEINAIMDISGLTDAIEEMNEIGLQNSNDSLIAGIVTKIESLPLNEQETLAKKFLDRFMSSAFAGNSLMTSFTPAEFTEEDCKKMSDLLIESLFSSLEDVGLAEEEKLRLRSLAGEISRPIDDLLQFYLKPKTIKHKIKRLWRMQRIFIKMIGLVNKLNAMASEPSQPSIGIAPVDVTAHIA